MCVFGITTIMEFEPEVMLVYFEKIIELMIMSLKCRDQIVAMAACDFWAGVVNMHEIAEAINAIQGVS
jgi:hypothetical protein